MTDLTDPIALAQALIRCPSITPVDAGALDRLESWLVRLGFSCERQRFQEAASEPVDNLYARLGTSGRNFCFAGHTDVVPVGDLAHWTYGPFAGEVVDGVLYGRGAADMKGAIAAFIAAVARHLAAGERIAGSVSLLITGDEEGPAINGTRAMLEHLEARGERIDLCLVGEPTNPSRMGEMAKIGRRGSLNGAITVPGHQGHVAYPHLARNPIPTLAAIIQALAAEILDEGSAHFQPSHLEVTNIGGGAGADNVIPAEAWARFNIRFNDHHRGGDLIARIEQLVAHHAPDAVVECRISGESFLTEPGPLTAMLLDAVRRETGTEPALSTSGGTSDARFIARHCPVVEFGLVGQSMHKVDEHAAVDDIETLTRIYQRCLASGVV